MFNVNSYAAVKIVRFWGRAVTALSGSAVTIFGAARIPLIAVCPHAAGASVAALPQQWHHYTLVLSYASGVGIAPCSTLH